MAEPLERHATLLRTIPSGFAWGFEEEHGRTKHSLVRNSLRAADWYHRLKAPLKQHWQRTVTIRTAALWTNKKQ